MLYFSITLYARRGSMFAWWIYSKAQKHGEIQTQLDSIKGQKKHVSQQGVDIGKKCNVLLHRPIRS